jgi:hypothetical protein
MPATFATSSSYPPLNVQVPACLIMGLLLHFHEPGTARSLVGRYAAG